MPYLSQITHPTELTQRKVNFFADYFQFASSQMGHYDGFEIENYLSLVEKIIYQVGNNVERCPRYLNRYLSHPLFHKDNKYFKEFKSHKNISKLFKNYSLAGSDGQKKNWIIKTPAFLKSLVKFRDELNRTLFKRALKAIISYLKCTHDIDEHKTDLIHYTNILVSEFLLNDRTKTDTANVFQKIITREIKDFPFPKSFLERNKEGNLEEAKKAFIENRTFDQQFEGIYNLLKQQGNRYYFLFRIYNIKADNTFYFKYNKVTFYHPKHEKLKDLNVASHKDGFHKDFFSNDEMLVAVVRVNYYSTEIAETNAVKLINEELPFLNKVCEANAYLEKHSYMITSKFKTFGGRWSRNERAHTISENERDILQDNPYRFLRKANRNCKAHLLKYESLFITAINSNDISDYWKYLETLLAVKSSNDKGVIETVSSLLLLNANEFHKSSLKNYIENCVHHLSYPESLIGLSKERQQFYYSQLSSKGKLNFEQLLSEIKHPFINHLSKIYLKPLTKENFKRLKHHYERILDETYAQRNIITHVGEANNKALISLYSTLPRLVMRFRWVVFDGMKRKIANKFEELLEKLKVESQKLV